MSSEIAIKVENLSKCYHIYTTPRDRLKQFIFPRLRRFVGEAGQQYFKEFWALRDVSFEVKKGESMGIIGRNGRGKSTLLQIICGTLTPTSGTVQTNGRIAALLELGTGFNPEFTGRENIYMTASIYGLTSTEVDARFDQIAAFADIGGHLEQAVKTYSSGMYVRLAFAVIAHVDANILVIDEALAVGDAFFTQKCMRFLREFMESGTVLLASHDTAAIKNLCSTANWLDKGYLREQGTPKEVCEHYLQNYYETQHDGLGVKNGESANDIAYLQTLQSKHTQDQRLPFLNATNLRNDLRLFQFNPDAPSFGLGGSRIIRVELCVRRLQQHAERHHPAASGPGRRRPPVGEQQHPDDRLRLAFAGPRARRPEAPLQRPREARRPQRHRAPSLGRDRQRRIREGHLLRERRRSAEGRHVDPQGRRAVRRSRRRDRRDLRLARRVRVSAAAQRTQRGEQQHRGSGGTEGTTACLTSLLGGLRRRARHALFRGEVADEIAGAVLAAHATGQARAERGLARVGAAIERDGGVERALGARRAAVGRTDAGTRADAAVSAAHRAGARPDARAPSVAGPETPIGGTALAAEIDADRLGCALARRREERARVTPIVAGGVTAHAVHAEPGRAIAAMEAALELRHGRLRRKHRRTGLGDRATAVDDAAVSGQVGALPGREIAIPGGAVGSGGARRLAALAIGAEQRAGARGRRRSRDTRRSRRRKRRALSARKPNARIGDSTRCRFDAQGLEVPARQRRTSRSQRPPAHAFVTAPTLSIGDQFDQLTSLPPALAGSAEGALGLALGRVGVAERGRGAIGGHRASGLAAEWRRT